MTQTLPPKSLTAFASSFLTCVLTVMLVISHAPAIAKTPTRNSGENTAKHTIQPPPSVDLDYTIKAQQKGLSLTGDASVQWRASKDQYSMTSETRAMLLGKILETKSE